ncbi:betaine/proline/choline family ABC transporter ATP-binding protein [candidate division GN15 bacterium]|nr:betaine/proline/choline family ABC transporter ATP-binding protein [candidate division GN15 bacterium]
MAQLRVEKLYKIFGPNPQRAMKLANEGKSKEEILDKTGCTLAINDASFGVEKGETFVVMGLSGSGKSTVLRCLNRLWDPTSGDIYLEDVNVAKADSETLRSLRRKKMSMVFQHFGLLPHRTVVDNVAFGLEIQNEPPAKRKEKAYETIKLVGLEGYGDMMTGELSGGMQQRVGLARALCTDPEILLMDEAFSALDPLIRTNMQDELIDLQEKVQKTIIFITHDLDEALKLGDRIAIMKDGAIVQIGTPEEILTDPADDYVASFVQNVDRSKVITASTLMFDHPQRVVSPREGVKVAIRRMRKMGISSLCVTDGKKQFKGFVHIDDAVKLEKKNEDHTLEPIVQSEVSTTSPDTPVVDLLPLVMSSNMPIAVIDDSHRLLGIVMRSSVIAEITGEESGIPVPAQEGETGAAGEDRKSGDQTVEGSTND